MRKTGQNVDYLGYSYICYLSFVNCQSDIFSLRIIQQDYKNQVNIIDKLRVVICYFIYQSKVEQGQYQQMFGKLKSLTSKAINSLPSISIPSFSSKIIIQTPIDQNLQAKLNNISSQILKAQQQIQFKVYQHLQQITEADFNRKLRIIYQHEECQTQTLNIIIRFYTFLLTNCKNELVICKLVSQPLVIELTKIVLQTQNKQSGSSQVEDIEIQKRLINNNRLKGETSEINEQVVSEQKQKQQKKQMYEQIRKSDDESEQKNTINDNIIEPKKKIDLQNKQLPKQNQQKIFKSSNQLSFSSLNYINPIDWEQVNVYKISLVRSYINCINAETIKYMIVYDNLPIFVNCINSYIHYLSDGVQGTCLGNCILMILTKVNHNDQVCEMIFSVRKSGNNRLINQNARSDSQYPQKLTKSISKQKDIRLHEFIEYILVCIDESIQKLQKEIIILHQTQQNCKQIQVIVKKARKVQNILEFIQSNSLFCTDLLNSITNYNYTTTIRKKIKTAVDQKLITNFKRIYQSTKIKNNQVSFNFAMIRSIRFILNVSIAAQAQEQLIKFLNQTILQILGQSLKLNKTYLKYSDSSDKKGPFFQGQKQNKIQIPDLKNSQKVALTYLCDICLIVLKLIMSPHSKLASRRRLQINQQIKMLKQSILKSLLQFLQQMVTFQQLKARICYKCVRNLLLAIFYLTIKQDKCTSIYNSPKKQEKSQTKNQKPNIDLLKLTFKYNILQLHKIYTLQFKKNFNQNKNWEFIANNYEQIMKSIPNTSLSPEQTQKYCHYHNGNNCQEWDEVRNHIYICQAVRNYRYMIVDATKIDQKLIRLQNIYHKNFITRAWKYQPGDICNLSNQKQTGQITILCPCLLINNNSKLPIQIIQDEECFVLALKKTQSSYKIIANIRFKKISSFVPQQNQNTIRIKLQGVQQIVLQISQKYKIKFKQYLNQKRNRSRQKQLKFINQYLNMYLKDSQDLLEQIYSQDIIDQDKDCVQKQAYKNNDKDQNPFNEETIVMSQPLEQNKNKNQQHIENMNNEDQNINEQEIEQQQQPNQNNNDHHAKYESQSKSNNQQYKSDQNDEI